MKLAVQTPQAIAMAGQLAAALEVSGWPKPGNVHRTADYPQTTYEQFIAGSIAIGPAIRLAASRGLMAGKGRIPYSSIGVGPLVKRATADMLRWQQGGNTHLGVILLFVPLAASAGVTLASEKLEPRALRSCLADVLRTTTPLDTVGLYEAIKMVSDGWWGMVEDKDAPPDLNDPDARTKLMKGGFDPIRVMSYSAPWDLIAEEWTTNMKVTFELGYPTFIKIYEERKNVNVATVHTFLTILAKKPDTFIARKHGLLHTRDIKSVMSVGMSKAKEVSEKASYVLELGGLLTEKGKDAIARMDQELRREELNPGSVADIMAASIFVALLGGFRP